MSKYSVIVVNYNTGKLLKDVVESALDNKGVDEIIVVDNHSQDNSMDLIDNSERVKKYFREDNYGFAASCNFGANIAKNKTLLFLNPDCIVTENSIDELVENLKENPIAAIIGCRVNNPDETEQRACRRRLPTLWRAIKTFSGIENFAKLCHCFAGVNLNHQPMSVTIKKVEAISGAFIMMKVEAFNKIGGFDEGYPMHFEDLDLFKRTLDAGYEILFNPNVSVIHHQGTSSKTNPKVESMKKEGLLRYFNKHGSKISYKLISIFFNI